MASRSLGTLTLDLVARTGGFVQGMDKAERSSAEWRKQVERDLKTIRGGIDKTLKAGAAAVAAATAATVALTKQGMDAVRSQADLARSLDTTFDSITALQLAAGDVGLDGLEGSLTRLNRRLGAAEVGSGAAANAVKALQLDLQALSEMDVDERVATIADAIRDSGVSMQRAARFAQDLGFEQRQAAEFFAQGGDAIRAYRERVEALGLSLSDIDAQKVVDAQNAMGIFGDLTRGASQILAVQFSPIIQQVATDLENAAIEAGGLSDNIGEMVDTAVQGVAFVASSVDAAGRVFSTLGKTAAIIFLEMRLKSYELGDSIYNGPIEAVNELIELLNIVSWIDITPRALSGIGQQIKDEISIIKGAIREGQQDVQDGLLTPLAGERLIKYFEDAKAAAEDAAQSAGKLRGLAGGSAPGDKPANAATADAIAKEITALERAATTWGMSANEVKLYDMAVQGATDTQLIHARAVMENIEAMEREAEAKRKIIEEQKRVDEQVGGVLDFLKTEEERLADSYEERRRIITDSSILAEEEKAAIVLALNEKLNADLMAMERARQSAMLTSYGTLFESLGGLTAQFAGKQSGIARAMFAVSKAFAIADSIVKIQQGIASAAAVPFPANIPAIASVAAATAGIVSTIQGTQLQGMAHAGHENIPREGTWLLDGGERVLSPEQNRDLTKFLSKDGQGSSTANTTNAPQINFNNEITIEAESGMSQDEARANGEAAAGAAKAIFISMVEKESRPGGLLWNLYGGGR